MIDPAPMGPMLSVGTSARHPQAETDREWKARESSLSASIAAIIEWAKAHPDYDVKETQ